MERKIASAVRWSPGDDVFKTENNIKSSSFQILDYKHFSQIEEKRESERMEIFWWWGQTWIGKGGWGEVGQFFGQNSKQKQFYAFPILTI